MATVFSTIGYILLAIGVFVVFLCLVVASKVISWFNFRQCKHCGHFLEYRGLKEDNENGHYLFHCTHCGAWEQVPKEEFIRNLDTSPVNE